jgi:hypothetical protein
LKITKTCRFLKIDDLKKGEKNNLMNIFKRKKKVEDNIPEDYNCLYGELILKYSKYDDDRMDGIKYESLSLEPIRGYPPEESKEIRANIAIYICEYISSVGDFAIFNESCKDAINQISRYALYRYMEKKIDADEKELFRIFTVVSFSLAFSVKYGLIELQKT